MTASNVTLETGNNHWPILLRIAWTTAALLTLVVILLSIPERQAQLQIVSPTADTMLGSLLPADSEALVQLGLSPATYAAWFTALEAISALIFLALGVLIFWRRPTDAMAVLFSLALLTFGMIASPLPSALAATSAGWTAVIEFLRAIGFFSLIVAFLLFPDGRFVPTWTRWLPVTWGAYVLLSLVIPELRFASTLIWQTTPEALLLAWVGTWLVMIVVVQVYRYRYVSPAAGRQQSKWVVFGAIVGLGIPALIVIPILSQGGMNSTGETIPILFRLIGVTFILFATIFFATTLAIAVLRYRLFDIEIIIRRTLVYSLLSACLGVFYFGLVVFLQYVLVPFADEGSPAAVVFSTLAIAALFTPLRRRIQNGIDRRFYRRKYDAAQALARFADVARNETDLEQLTTQLLHVINDTMQPVSVGLWLRPDQAQPER